MKNTYVANAGILINKENGLVKNCNINDCYEGILLRGNYNRIENCTIEGCIAGISFTECSENLVICSKIKGITMGIWLYYSSYDTIYDCNITNGYIYIDGKLKEHFFHNIKGCRVNGKDIIYIKNETDIEINEEAGEIIIVNSSNFKIKNVEMNNSITIVGFSKNGEITDCKVNSGGGIHIYYSRYISIERCNLSHCKDGVVLFHSVFSKIKDCKIENNEGGIMLWQSSFNRVEGCNIVETKFNN